MLSKILICLILINFYLDCTKFKCLLGSLSWAPFLEKEPLKLQKGAHWALIG